MYTRNKSVHVFYGAVGSVVTSSDLLPNKTHIHTLSVGLQLFDEDEPLSFNNNTSAI